MAEGLEITLWASTPMLHNPTNIDIDKDGRIWVAEGVRYRRHHARQPEGDRIVVLQDTRRRRQSRQQAHLRAGAGLVAPLGVSVIDNKIVVAQPPDLIVYTDVDRNLRFDPAVDKREVLLTGFHGANHDHSLHSVTVGPDGKWVFNQGNTGAMFTDRSGKTFRSFGAYRDGPVGPFKDPHNKADHAGKPSDDGHVYVGGFTVRMNPDGTDAEIIGYNYRNSYEQSVTSLGDVFQNDNDDPPACRVSWVMEYANFGFSSLDGQRSWQADRRPGQTVQVAEWRQDDPGVAPAGDVYGGGSPTGNVFYENGALGAAWEGTFFAAEPGRNEVFAYRPSAQGAGFDLGDRQIFVTSNAAQKYAGSDFIGGSWTAKGAVETLFRPSDVAVGPDGALYVSDWIDARVGGHTDLDDTTAGAIYRIAPKGFVSKPPAFDPATIEGLITALRSPAVNVRAIGFEGLKARGAVGGRRRGGAARRSEPVHARPRPLSALSARARGPPARRHAGIAEGSRDEDRGLPRHAARRPRRPAGRRASRARSRRRRPARGGALAARPARGRVARHPGRLARGFDGKDRSYLEALGTGATGKEAALYDRLRRELRVPPDPVAWTTTFAWIAWRLHPPACRRGSCGPRARGEALARRPPPRDRRARLHRRSGRVRRDAEARRRKRSAARAGDVVAAEPDVQHLGGPQPAGGAEGDEDLRPGDDQARRGRRRRRRPSRRNRQSRRSCGCAATPRAASRWRRRCVMCHAIGGAGADVGPALDGWGRGKSAEVIARAIVQPSAEIAQGYDGTELRTTDGLIIQGLLIKQGDPLMIRSRGGVTQIVPANRVANRRRMMESLMMSAAQLGLTAQDVADLVAFLSVN